jgi:hypothetical protein
MTWAEEAFRSLYPSRKMPRIEIKYTGRMAPYNSNVTYRTDLFVFKLSREWEEVEDPIKKGMVQSLLMRVYKTKKKKTHNTDLYDSFMRHLHRTVAKDKNDPDLDASYKRVNKKFFSDTIERPNLEWGGFTRRVLGNYNYHTDTIKISSYFKDAPLDMLDYIMYHELLHKRIKFHTTGGRSFHHTKKFRDREAKYPGFKGMDDKIHEYLVRKRKPRGKKEKKKEKKQFSLFSWLR